MWYVVVVELVSCDVGYYSQPQYTEGNDCLKCPTGGVCNGGSSLPYPEPGYWIDRSEYKYGGDIYRCVIDTCVGYAKREEKILDATYGTDSLLTEEDDTSTSSYDYINCWSQDDFNRSVCNSNSLMCSKGSTGPLW